jgi:8-oxo-dGTP pyrophosphatase MutT (NUDIX family)
MLTKPIDVEKSCGIIYLLNSNHFLICHATNSRYWSIPKGLKDAGENDIEAAIREMREETGIIINDPENLYKVYDGYYTKFKDLAAFMYMSKEDSRDLKKFVCTSMYYDTEEKRELPEVDRYMFVDIDFANRFMNTSQYKIVRKTFEQNIW